MVDNMIYFLFQCNKSCGMCYPVCGKVHIKEPLLSERIVAAAGFLSTQSGPLPYVRRQRIG